jgi:lysophospholipase L1-like esterase
MKNKFITITLLSVFLLFQIIKISAQPFAEDIQAFKKLDSISFPPKHTILFVGSSSFTNWKDVQNYFPGFSILNRGFGGSSVSDVIRYADDIIFPYRPKQIVIYCGENDLAASDTVTGRMVYQRFMQLFKLIRNRMPAVPVAFISLKPSPSRWHLRNKMMEANSLIKKYLLGKKGTKFIDVYHNMLNSEGTPIKDIFLEDELHMNAKGYAIWQKLIEPVLVK